MTHGRVAKLLAVLAVTFASAATSAHAAVTTNYPTAANARTFAASDGNWTSGTVVSGICLVVCSNGSGTYQSTGGIGTAPDGYLRSSFSTGLGVLSDTTTTWTSPSFTVSGNIDQATLTANVRTQLGSLLTLLGGSGTLTAKLHDTTSASTTTLSTVSLANGSSFVPVSFAVPANALTAGHTYTIALAARATTGAIASVLASGTVDLDDVSLNVTDLIPPTNLDANVSTASGVTVCGNVDPHNQLTTVVVQYGVGTSYGATTAPEYVNGNGAQAYCITLPGLTPGQTYHFRVVATNADGNVETTDATFLVPSIGGNGGPTVTGPVNGRHRHITYDLVVNLITVRVQVIADDGVTVISDDVDSTIDGSFDLDLPNVDGRYYIRIIRIVQGGGTTYSPWVITTLDRVGPSNGGTPVVTGDIAVRPRHVRFVRAADAVSARVRVLLLDGTIYDTVDVPAGGDIDICCPTTTRTTASSCSRPTPRATTRPPRRRPSSSPASPRAPVARTRPTRPRPSHRPRPRTPRPRRRPPRSPSMAIRAAGRRCWTPATRRSPARPAPPR
jgi:hypothetical protein